MQLNPAPAISTDQFDASFALEPQYETVTLDDMVQRADQFDAAELRMAPPERTPAQIVGVRIGTLAELDESGLPLVDFPGNPAESPIPARTTIPLTPADARRGAVLMFEEGSPQRPIILGLLEEPADSQVAAHEEEETEGETDDATADSPMWVEADGQRVVVAAEQELVLCCGKASITLTKAGKILIRGAYVSSRSSGVNRIKGGSVQIN